MINGHSATYHTTGGTLRGPELIPIEIVESIEIIRGTGSALYGANAFLGGGNIVTRTPEQDSVHLESSGEIGLTNVNLGGGGSAVGSVAKGDAYLQVSFSGGYVDRSGLLVPDSSPVKETWGDKTGENDLSRPWTLFTDGAIDLGPLGRLHAQYSHRELDAFGEFSYLSTLTHSNRIAVKNDVVGIDHNVEVSGQRPQSSDSAYVNPTKMQWHC